MRRPHLFLPLLALVLTACGPSQAERDVTAIAEAGMEAVKAAPTPEAAADSGMVHMQRFIDYERAHPEEMKKLKDDAEAYLRVMQKLEEFSRMCLAIGQPDAAAPVLAPPTSPAEAASYPAPQE